MDYSAYMQSVTADASRRTAAAVSAYMATASDFGVRQVTSGGDPVQNGLGWSGAWAMSAGLICWVSSVGM